MHCYRGDTEVAYLLVIEKICARGIVQLWELSQSRRLLQSALSKAYGSSHMGHVWRLQGVLHMNCGVSSRGVDSPQQTVSVKSIHVLAQ